MEEDRSQHYVSRAGVKLAHGLREFAIKPDGWICADLGSSTGGFVDCLLQHGAARVYAVERGYGVINYQVRTDRRVVVMERTDALHVRLPERVHLVSIDAGWTRQEKILSVARGLVQPDGHIVTLVKTQYEADPACLHHGVLPDEHIEPVLSGIRTRLDNWGMSLAGETESPIRGHGGNREFLFYLRPQG